MASEIVAVQAENHADAEEVLREAIAIAEMGSRVQLVNVDDGQMLQRAHHRVMLLLEQALELFRPAPANQSGDPA